MGNQLNTVNSIQDAFIDRFKSVALTTDEHGTMRIRSFSEVGFNSSPHHHHHQQQHHGSGSFSGRGGRILRESSIDGGVAVFDAMLRDDHEHRLSLDAMHRVRHLRTSCTTIPEEDIVSLIYHPTTPHPITSIPFPFNTLRFDRFGNRKAICRTTTECGPIAALIYGHPKSFYMLSARESLCATSLSLSRLYYSVSLAKALICVSINNWMFEPQTEYSYQTLFDVLAVNFASEMLTLC